MARIKKAFTLEEQLQKIEHEKAMTENILNELNKSHKEISEKIRMNRLSKLDDMIQSKGLSFDEVEDILQKQNTDNTTNVALA